jgi:hypothetical protein
MAGERPAGEISWSSGDTVAHCAIAFGQRGWNRQPLGGLMALGTSPGMSCCGLLA